MAGQREKLTAARVARHACPLGQAQAFLWDIDAPGFAVRATPGGTKAFIFQGRLAGKAIRLTIGDIRSWAIDNARAEARRLQTLIDQGIDPKQAKADKLADLEAKRVQATMAEVTAGEAWNAYINARAPKWGARHLQNHIALAKAGGVNRTRGRRPGEPAVTLPGPIHPLLTRRLADLDAKTVRTWLEQETIKGPTQAAQAYRVVRAFLAWAADQHAYAGIVHTDACNRRMARDVLPRANPKTDVLQREQLPAWFAAVRKIGSPVISTYLQMLLLTGARREELATLTWKNVDFKWHSLTIKDKVEGERIIPLTPYAESLLLALKYRNDTPPAVHKARQIEAEGRPWKPSPWVFASPTAASGRITEPRIAHKQALAIAGIEGLTLHGLRRSFKSLSEWLEMPVGIVAQIMGHKPSATAEKHYTVRPLDLLRMWHTKYEQWILEQADIDFERAEFSLLKAKPALRTLA